jgi:hypothetical protein
VEEVDLRGVKTGGSGRDSEVDGGNGTDSGFSGNSVSFNLFSEIVDGSLGEDEGDLLSQEGNQSAELRDFATILLFEVTELFIFDAFGSHSDDLLDEGLLEREGTFLEMTRMLLVALSCLRIIWIWLEPTFVKVVRMICL